MITYCLRLSELFFCLGSLTASAQRVPPGTSPAMEQVFVQCDELMNNNQYDSAFSVLSLAFVHRLTECTPVDRYYLHALMCEIL